jgi:hypothetical protein
MPANAKHPVRNTDTPAWAKRKLFQSINVFASLSWERLSPREGGDSRVLA